MTNKKYLTKEKIREHIYSFLKEIAKSQDDRILLAWEAEEILKLLEQKDNRIKELEKALEKKDKTILKMAKQKTRGLK